EHLDVAEPEDVPAVRREGGVPLVADREEVPRARQREGTVLEPTRMGRADFLDPGGVVEEQGRTGAAPGADRAAVRPHVVDRGLAPPDAFGKACDVALPVRVDRYRELCDDRNRARQDPGSFVGTG